MFTEFLPAAMRALGSRQQRRLSPPLLSPRNILIKTFSLAAPALYRCEQTTAAFAGATHVRFLWQQFISKQPFTLFDWKLIDLLMQSMAGGVMGQVQGLIPGMKKEEEVPDPAQVQEGEYQEYAEEQYQEQYTEEQYAQWGDLEDWGQ